MTMDKRSIDNKSESVIVDACKVANKLDEQQDKYNTLYTTFKEIKDKGIKFDYCPDAQEKYVDTSLSIQSSMNRLKEDLDGLEYLIQQDAEEIASTKIDELNKERYTGYLRDVETHLEDMKRMNHDISNLPYLKETFNILEPVPKIQKDVAMDFQAKESNLDYIGEYKKANKKLERTRRQRTLTHIHTFIRDDLHDQLEINAKSIIKRETAVIEQDKKKIIPTVASANKKQKEPEKKKEPIDYASIRNKIEKITHEIDQFMPTTSSALDIERLSNSLGQISSVLKNHEQVLQFLYDPFKEKKTSDISHLDPMYALQSIDTIQQTPCLTEALAAAVVKMTENRFSDYNRRLDTLSKEIDGLDSL